MEQIQRPIVRHFEECETLKHTALNLVSLSNVSPQRLLNPAGEKVESVESELMKDSRRRMLSKSTQQRAYEFTETEAPSPGQTQGCTRSSVYILEFSF